MCVRDKKSLNMLIENTNSYYFSSYSLKMKTPKNFNFFFLSVVLLVKEVDDKH